MTTQIDEYVNGIILDFDILVLNGKGVVTQAIKRSDRAFPFVYDRKTKKGKMSDDFYSFLQVLNSKLPAGISYTYEIHPKGDHATPWLFFKVTQTYAKERYCAYYSKEFERKLLDEHANDLHFMAEKIPPKTYESMILNSCGLRTSDDGCGYDYYFMFDEMGLKPLDSLVKVFTLAKVLTNLKTSSDNEYSYGVDVKKNGNDEIEVNIRAGHKPKSQNKEKLSEW